MRVSALPARLAIAALLVAGAGCATTIEGTGSIAEDVLTGAPTPTSTSDSTDSTEPTATTPAPSPPADQVLVRQRLLCVLERASITSINNQFNKSKNRETQLRALRTGATTISGHLKRSGLPAGDRIRKPGQGVLDELTGLVRKASVGGTPSTAPYNRATQRFQQACDSV